MSRFLCVGDLHLDAGPDLGRAPGDRLAEQEAVWRRCLEIAYEQDVDAILFAGDAFHKARPSPEALLAFERPLVESDRSPAKMPPVALPSGFEVELLIPQRPPPIIAILGNHDVAGASLGTGLEVFAEAGLLTLAREPAIHAVAGVGIACLPWVAASRVVAAQGGGDRDFVNAHAAELLVATARGLREQIDGPAILLTHFSISGSALPNGLPVEQLREPVLELGDLEALGFDAIVAGHIHAPQAFGEGTFYVGSPMPLSFGEAETDHGVWILDAGRYTAFAPIESRSLVTLDLDHVQVEDWIERAETFIDPEEYAVEGAIIRVRIHATQEQARRLDVPALKRNLVEQGAHKVYAVQLEIEKPERARVEGLTEELDELAALDLWMEASEINGDRATELRERTERYLGVVRA